MNETLSVIENRKSTRNFSPAEISEEEKDAILHATMRAPTAGNLMLYSIIEVEDQTLKERLAVTCDNQPFIAKAPYVLLFVADYQRFFDFFMFSDAETACVQKGFSPRLPQEGDLLLACCDALIAAQTAVIAAESMGIGSCYIGDILENAEIHREIFHLPRYTLPITLLCFGRPAVEKSEKRLTPRYERKYIVFKNAYRRLAAGEFPHMVKTAAEHNFPELTLEEAAKTLGQNIYMRKYVSEFSVEMNRSVRGWISQWNGQQESD